MSFRIKNLTDSNKRIALKANQDFLPFKEEVNNNPTTNIEENFFKFCLSPSSLISCAGAERVANIWFNGQSSGAMVNVKIEITNEDLTREYGSFFSPLSSLIDIINFQTNINFYIGCGGEVFISNEEYTEYRVKITIQDTSIIIGGDSESNPTLFIDQAKGTFEFCLAPYRAM